MIVDLVILSRDLGPLRDDVLAGIAAQEGVNLVVHRQEGPPHPDDPHRWATIARARNHARGLGSSPWILLLDDDVVLAPGCVRQLLDGLLARREFAALAADSAGVMSGGWEHWDYPSHVGMAAILFRRERLAEVTFRWEPGRCECLCCADDLRRRGHAVGYQPGALAWHRPQERPASQAGSSAPTAPREGRILAAFDRRDHVRFRKQFLKTLRESGNQEPVWAFAYGLYPTEAARLAAEPGVEVVSVPHDGVCPALRRLRDFQPLLDRWPRDTPVAYWDAGDILFQDRLTPLWSLVAEHPDRLLVVPEPLSYPDNPIIGYWSDFVIDPDGRRRTFEAMAAGTFLNSGFAAGTAAAMLDYLREGDRLLNSPVLYGVREWGDQPAMNVYCHDHPDRCRLVDPGWNYALAGRPGDQYVLTPQGHATRVDGGPVRVLHGNAASLRWLELMPPSPVQFSR